MTQQQLNLVAVAHRLSDAAAKPRPHNRPCTQLRCRPGCVWRDLAALDSYINAAVRSYAHYREGDSSLSGAARVALRVGVDDLAVELVAGGLPWGHAIDAAERCGCPSALNRHADTVEVS